MKLLIATGDAAGSPDELPASIRSLIEQAEEVFVVAPTLPKQILKRQGDARKRMNSSLTCLTAIRARLASVGVV